MHKPKAKPEALKEYCHSLELRFKNKDEMETFVARYLDGSGEQSINCYTESVTEDGTWNAKTKQGYTKASWHWDHPMMFINVEEMEEYE